MRKNYAVIKKAMLPYAEESELSDEWISNEEVMAILKSTRNTVKKLRDEKILPHGKLGAKLYYNKTDVRNMFLALRRLSLV